MSSFLDIIEQLAFLLVGKIFLESSPDKFRENHSILLLKRLGDLSSKFGFPTTFAQSLLLPDGTTAVAGSAAVFLLSSSSSSPSFKPADIDFFCEGDLVVVKQIIEAINGTDGIAICFTSMLDVPYDDPDSVGGQISSILFRLQAVSTKKLIESESTFTLSPLGDVGLFNGLSARNMDTFIIPLLFACPELRDVSIVFPSKKLVEAIDVIFLKDRKKVQEGIRLFDVGIVMASLRKNGDDGLILNIEESVENHVKKKTSMSIFTTRVMTAYTSKFADVFSTQLAYFKLWEQEPNTTFYLNARSLI